MKVNETHFSVLNNETIIDTRLKHLQHLNILHVVAYVFKDIAV